MTDPINIKTAKIFESLKQRHEEKEYNEPPNTDKEILERDLVYEILSKNSDKTIASWIRLQQTWSHAAYNVFKDYDTYLILIFLINKMWKNYADRFMFFSMEEFYTKEEAVIEKINLIEIAGSLNIPKETIRRKISLLQDLNFISRKGKSIYLNVRAFDKKRPTENIILLSKFLEKNSELLSKEDWFGKKIAFEDIHAFITKYFTICWKHFYMLQIPFFVRYRKFFGDLETWNVWAAIGVAQFADLQKKLDSSLISRSEDYKDFFIKIFTHKPEHGINASSISDISTIPRATVIRKLRILEKNKLIKKDSKLEYISILKGKNANTIKENYMTTQRSIAMFVAEMFDLMKNSNLKL